MGQDQAASQAKMDDLLASLRRGLGSDISNSEIRNDTGDPAIRSAEPAISSLVLASAQISASDEISTLRKRIAGKIGRDPSRNGFSTILSGQPSTKHLREPALLELRSPEFGSHPPDAPPVLRQTLNDEDTAFVQTPVETQKPEAAPRRARTRPAQSPAGWSAISSAEQPEVTDRALMSETSSAAANASFNRLAETLMARTFGDRPLEGLTREMLRTLLKQWLDENLPSLVERIVRDEIERVARRGPRR